MKPTHIPPFFLFIFIVIILSTFLPYVWAEEDPDVNIMNFPQQLASRFAIPEFAAGILLTIIIGMAIMLPFGLLKLKFIYNLLIGLPYLGFVIVIGWCPYWIVLLILIIVAAIYSGKIRRSL